jgi:Zn-dependent protease
MDRRPAADTSDVKTLRAARSTIAAEAVPVSVARGALVPSLLLMALFVLVGTPAGLPIGFCALLGGIGGPLSLLVHEFGHVSAARRVKGVRPARVSLIWAGAATRLEGAYSTGRDQARVAIGGPEASFALALALAAFAMLPLPMTPKGGFLLLAGFNVLVGLFNLLPAHPLDGHKVVVGLLWSKVGSECRARRIIRRIGRGWLVVELASGAVLFVEKPEIGIVTAVMAATLFGQKALMQRLRR